ncbi:hypothetical protein [Stenotrophomonas tumulicola]|uniref:SH3 domain-containing protein n=1 Tax=Stenotrophomonas tumulicola TaxID=1685415 RepID=A0A7W3FJK4_9GAMM|nr:hypothetical protein [Stenotrophomonas tumulicola]MBA8680762.1 hypothetical protein [Stenotrophomonas tumulicola]
MIRALLAVALVLPLSACANASALPCDALPQEAASKPVEANGTVFCFVHARPQDEAPGSAPSGPAAISVYASRQGAPATFVYELPYSGTDSVVDDAFLANGRSAGEQVVIIHSSDAPSTFEITGKLHDVTVLDVSGKHPVVSEKARKFFDIGGDVADASGNITFHYPYKTRQPVIAALDSPIFNASASNPVAAQVKDKAFLYPEPDSRVASKAYVIKGDTVSVQDASGGWCQVSYQGKSKAIVRWMQCELLQAP